MISMHIFWLALIQGLTEFLPVSSSGHLILFAKFSSYGDLGQAMDIALHIGSLVAVVLYFWHTIKNMLVGLWRNKFMPNFANTDVRLAYYILFATIPAIIIGGLFSYFGTEWTRNTKIIGGMLIFYSIVLWYADTKFSTAKTLKEMRLRDALFIGFAQCLAFIPGTSRSGVTITIGRFLGYNRSEVAKFSMLLSIPSILAAGMVAAYQIGSGTELYQITLAYQAIALSFIFSFLAIFLMMRWLRFATFLPFVVYRVLLGGILLLHAYDII